MKKETGTALGDRSPYEVEWPVKGIPDLAVNTAADVRGHDRSPAIMIYGVMRRSGTVYVGELLRLHPDLEAYPNEMWEVPFLKQTPRIQELQRGFIDGYRQNDERMGGNEFLPLFGASFLAYLHAFMPAGKRLLVKEAGVEYLGYFPAVFPHEHLLLVMRDGRDVVHSYLRTWPDTDFTHACQRWADSARTVRRFHEAHADRLGGYALVKFEDVLTDPAAFIREACTAFGLDPDRYPFERIARIRVIGSSTLSAEGKVDWSRHEAVPSDFKPTGHWGEWPERWRRKFKEIAARELVDTGYALDADW